MLPPNPSSAHAQPAPQNRRQLIVQTTLDLIATHGVDAVSHRKVAAAAGVPLGSTTYYFESRSHLIRAAFDHYLNLVQRWQSEVGSRSADSANALIEFLVALAQREFEQREYVLAEYEMTLFAARDPALATALNGWYDAMLGRMAQALAAAGADDPAGAARSVLHLMRGHELERLTRDEPDATLKDRLARLLAAYLPATESPSETH